MNVVRIASLITQLVGACIAAAVAVSTGPVGSVGWWGTATLLVLWIVSPFGLLGWASWLNHDEHTTNVYFWGGAFLAAGAVLAYVVPRVLIISGNIGVALMAVPVAHMLGVMALFGLATRQRTSAAA